MLGSMNEGGLMLTVQAIRRQLAAMPHDPYLIRLIHNGTARVVPGQRLWTATQLLDPATIRFLRVRNRQGCDVYMQPYAGDQNAGYILVDLDRAGTQVIEQMRSNGHHPCLVLQTSPGHLQAWIHVSTSALEPCIATAVARQLAHDYGGDPASADWRHVGRLAGFTNQKLSRRSLRGYGPWVKIVHAHAGRAPQAEALVHSAMLRWRPLWLCSDGSPPIPSHSRSTGPNPASAITSAEATAIYTDCLHRWRITERFPQPDWSIVDLWVARHLLSQGMPAPQVESILQLGSPQFPRRHGNSLDYLRRTVARAAFPPTGGSVCQDHAPASVPADIRSACSNSTGGR
jgi:hypothetical protein